MAVPSRGVAIGPLLAAMGAAGFALQGTLSDFASGPMILRDL